LPARIASLVYVERLYRIAVLSEHGSIGKAIGGIGAVVPALQSPYFVVDDVEILETVVSGARLILHRPKYPAVPSGNREDLPQR
jgi:hypothetical protein